MFCLMFLLAANPPGDWREFRGPDGTGHYVGPKIVTEWGVDKNVVWKEPVPGLGWSSPIIVNGTLILTTALPTHDDGRKLIVLAFDSKTGRRLWSNEVFVAEAKSASQMHKKNSHASPTPVSDGRKVWVHFGHLGTACLALTGEQAGMTLWKTNDYAYKPMHGNGGSPILVDDKLVFSVDGVDVQYVLALDKETGQVAWKTDRRSKAGMKFSFSTPQLITVGQQRMIVSAASDFVAAYDPSDGKELWRVSYPQPGWSLITRPVFAQGLVFVQSGYVRNHLLAIDPLGRDSASRIVWKADKGAPNTPTPLAVETELYVVSDDGRMTCFEAKTGKVHWSERLKGRAYSASPILVNGLIYVTSEDGVGQVVKATTSGFEQVSESRLGEKTYATFVPSEGALFVRTETQLYRFEAR